jgi:predicted RNA polymerase sigma factor
MAELDDLARVLGEYHLYHATCAELLRELGRPEQARAADQRALELTANPKNLRYISLTASPPCCYRTLYD